MYGRKRGSERKGKERIKRKERKEVSEGCKKGGRKKRKKKKEEEEKQAGRERKRIHENSVQEEENVNGRAEK